MAEKSSSRIALVVAALVGIVIVAVVLWKGGDGGKKPKERAAATAPAREVASEKAEQREPRGVASASSTPGVTAAASASSRVFVKARWGGGKGQIGRDAPEEGNPEGPMSFALDGRGRMVVLDQINNRLVRYGEDGNLDREVRIEAKYPQDIAIGADGSMAVLDRLVDKNVTMLDAEGNVVGQIPLEGEAIGETGGVTGVFVEGDDVYVEREHSSLIKVGKTTGEAATDQEPLPGRPSRDGRLLLQAGLTDAAAGRMYVAAIDRATREHRFTREILVDGMILFLVLLDSDLKGTIYTAALVERGQGDDVTHGVRLYCLEPTTGAVVGGAELPASSLPDETFRDLVVLDEGGVMVAVRTEQGVAYELHHCQ